MTDRRCTDDSVWVCAIKVDELPEGHVMSVDIGGHPVAIYHLEGGTFWATDDLCTHGAASLSDGFLDGDVIECPLHGGCFEVRTGKGLGEPIERDIATYPVRVEGGEVLIAWPDRPS